jgi:hypothetical protein
MAEVIQLADLTPNLRERVCNGCGPSGWKKHTWRWKLARLVTSEITEACHAHDLAYWLRGTKQDREQADIAFRNAIGEIAKKHSWFVRWLLEQEQPILYAWLVGYGGDHFKVGPKKTKVDVNKAAHNLGDDPLPYPELGIAA